MNNYLIESNDSILIKNKEKELISKNNFSEYPVDIYDLEEDELQNALEDLDTFGLLSTKKVIIIKNIEALKYDDYKRDFDHLFKYLDNSIEDNLLIIEAKKLDNKTKISKSLKKKCSIVSTDINTKSFIKNKLKEYKIDMSTIGLLDEYCMGDITKLNNECDKLMNYKLDEKVITKEDIIKLVPKKESDSRELTFEFTRALATKNKKHALKLFKELLDLGVDSIGIIGLLASQFRIIMQVKLLEKNTNSNRDIANTLGEKEFRIKKTRELTRYYSEKEIEELIISLQDIDFKSKTTDIDANSLIELFIINL